MRARSVPALFSLRAPVAWATLLAICLGPGAAAARDPREVEAKKKCLAGDVARGVALLAELYVESNDPTYLYNQGRCFQQNGRARDAISRFREYLRKTPQLAPTERAEVERFIAELERDVATERGESGRNDGVRSAPAPAMAAPAVAAPAQRAVADGGEGGAGSPLKMVAVAAGAVGIAMVGVGAYFGTRVLAIEKDAEARFERDDVVDPSDRERGDRAAKWQWIGYGVGAAAIVGAVSTYLLARRADARFALAPFAAPDGAGAGMRVAF